MYEDNSTSQPDVILQNEITKQNELVLQIHNDIDTAQDRLLERARNIINDNSIKTTILDKVNRLKKLGFTSTNEVVETDKKINLLEMTKKEAETIQYYKKNYIDLKFLTIEEFENICNKYNLIYAPVSNYIKDIPDENLLEIESVKSLKKSDSINEGYKYILEYTNTNYVPIEAQKWINGNIFDSPNYLDSDIKKMCPIKIDGPYVYNAYGKTTIKLNSDDLYIAAPKSHFNLNGLIYDNEKGFYDSKNVIEPKDPIVFRYVKGGLQILSKWGIESLDQRLNISNIN